MKAPATSLAYACTLVALLAPLRPSAHLVRLGALPGTWHRVAAGRFRAPRAVARRAIPRAVLSDDLALLLSKTLDTAEDALMHVRRFSMEATGMNDDKVEEAIGWYDDVNDRRPVVVVLGAGWAAHAFVKIIDNDLFRVVVVSPRMAFLFTPMLAASAVGTVEYRSICEPLRMSNPLIDYVEGMAVRADPVEQTVDVELSSLLERSPTAEVFAPLEELTRTPAAVVERAIEAESTQVGGVLTAPLPAPPQQGRAARRTPTTRDTVRIRYDHLVVACGSRVSASIVPGAEDNCHKLKEVDDARRLRTAIGEAFDLAARPGTSRAERFRLLHFIIVGGGPTGVELAGELTDWLVDMAKLYPRLAPITRITIIQSGPELLPQFDGTLRQTARERLEARGVTVLTNVRVQEVGPKSIRIREKGPARVPSEPDEDMPYGVCIWCAGNKPQPFVEQLLDSLPPMAAAPDGRIAVDSWLRVRLGGEEERIKMGSVFAMGDVAYECYEDTDDATAEGACEPLPQTAQVAAQQGPFVARMLNRGYALDCTPPRLGAAKEVSGDAVTEFWAKAANWWVRVRGLEEPQPFKFLNLGILAYIGGGEALSQVQLGDKRILAEAGSVRRGGCGVPCVPLTLRPPRGPPLPRGRSASCSGGPCISSSRCPRRAKAQTAMRRGGEPHHRVRLPPRPAPAGRHAQQNTRHGRLAQVQDLRTRHDEILVRAH